MTRCGSHHDPFGKLDKLRALVLGTVVVHLVGRSSSFAHASSYSCDFESANTCTWGNGVTTGGQWLVNQGKTPTNDTGADSAYSGSYYAYIESSSPNHPQVNFDLVLDLRADGASLNVASVSFMYTMRSPNPNMWQILKLQTSDDCASWSDLWGQQGNQGTSWHAVAATLDAPSPCVRFLGQTGKTEVSDISLDDISVATVSLPTPLPTLSLLPTAHSDEVVCTFDEGEMCPGYETGADSAHSWLVHSLSTDTDLTGPPNGAAHGSYYAYVEATDNHPGERFELQLELPGKTMSGVSFFYNMRGDDIGTLEIQVAPKGCVDWSTAWSLSGNQGAEWMLASVVLTPASTHRCLRFVGTTGSGGDQGDIAIDTITIHAPRGPTPSPSATPLPTTSGPTPAPSVTLTPTTSSPSTPLPTIQPTSQPTATVAPSSSEPTAAPPTPEPSLSPTLTTVPTMTLAPTTAAVAVVIAKTAEWECGGIGPRNSLIVEGKSGNLFYKLLAGDEQVETGSSNWYAADFMDAFTQSQTESHFGDVWSGGSKWGDATTDLDAESAGRYDSVSDTVSDHTACGSLTDLEFFYNSYHGWAVTDLRVVCGEHTYVVNMTGSTGRANNPSHEGRVEDGYEQLCANLLWFDSLRDDQNAGDNFGDWYRKMPLVAATSPASPAPSPPSRVNLIEAMASSMTTALVGKEWKPTVQGEIVGYVNLRYDYRLRFDMLLSAHSGTDDTDWTSIVSVGYDQGYYCPQGQAFCRRPSLMWHPDKAILRIYEGSTTAEPEGEHVDVHGCLDVAGWNDTETNTCASYEEKYLCTSDGSYGAGWTSNSSFADLASQGHDASTACCACGGGSDQGNMDGFEVGMRYAVDVAVVDKVMAISIDGVEVATTVLSQEWETESQQPVFVSAKTHSEYPEAPVMIANLEYTELFHCDKGFYYPDDAVGEVCTPCPVGTYADQAGSYSCNKCPAGRVASQEGSYECTLCPSGFYLPYNEFPSGHDEMSDCVKCSPGSKSSDDRSNCVECGAGSEANDDGVSCRLCLSGTAKSSTAGPCTMCQAGTFASGVGSLSCASCSAGHSCEAGATGETECPGGTFSPEGSSLQCSLCSKGEFSLAGQSKCTECPPFHTTTRVGTADACDSCERDYYFYGGQCVPCPDHAICVGGTKQPAPQEGWWSDHSDPALAKKIYRCLRPTCVGGQKGKKKELTRPECWEPDDNFTSVSCLADDLLCDKGATGILCGSCQEGYAFASSSGTCELCDGGDLITTRVLTIILLFLVLTAAVTWKMGALRLQLPDTEVLKWILNIDLGTVRMLFSNISILSAVPETLNVEFPEPARSLLGALSGLTKLSPLNLVSAACVHSSFASYQTYTIVTSLVAIGICALVWLTFAVKCFVLKSDTRHRLYTDHMWAYLLVTFLAYPTLSLAQFRGLDCSVRVAGNSYLRHDISVDCSTQSYHTFRVFIVLLILVTQSVPVLYLSLLFPQKETLNAPFAGTAIARLKYRRRLENGTDLAPIKFLFQYYKCTYFYFEVVDLIRRVLFVAVLPLVSDERVRAAVGCFMAFLFTILFQDTRPFISESTNVLAVNASQMIVLVYFTGMMLRFDLFDSDDQAAGMAVVGTVVFIILVAVHLGRLDHMERVKNQATIENLHDQLEQRNIDSQVEYLKAWTGYVNHAQSIGFEPATLYASLEKLKVAVSSWVSDADIMQPEAAAKMPGLINLMTASDEQVHIVMKAWVRDLNAQYKQGPQKTAARILAKAHSDYHGNLRRILDGVRASAVFHSLRALNDCVLSLCDPDCPLKVVRVKERFTTPLPSGYRDILLNVKIEGIDLIVELQLHLQDIIELKKAAHKTYDLMRAAGWDGDRVEEVELSAEERKRQRISAVRQSSSVGPAEAGDSKPGRSQVAPAPGPAAVQAWAPTES